MALPSIRIGSWPLGFLPRRTMAACTRARFSVAETYLGKRGMRSASGSLGAGGAHVEGHQAQDVLVGQLGEGRPAVLVGLHHLPGQVPLALDESVDPLLHRPPADQL